MSETEQAAEPEEQGDEQPDASSDTSEKPSVEQGEMADLGSVAAELEEASQKQQDEGESSEDGDDDQADEQGDLPDRGVDPSEADISIGTVYTNALGMSAAVARGRYGSLDDEDDRDDVADEYASMARQIQLDEWMDQWIAEQGGLDGLSPGEAVLLGTLMWGGMVLLDDPEMAENMLGEVRDS